MIKLKGLHEFDDPTEKKYLEFQFPRDRNAFRLSCLLAILYTIGELVVELLAFPSELNGFILLFRIAMIIEIAVFALLTLTRAVTVNNYPIYFQAVVVLYVALLFFLDFYVTNTSRLAVNLAFLAFVVNAGMGLSFLRAFSLNLLFTLSYFIFIVCIKISADGSIDLCLTVLIASIVGFLHERQLRIIFYNQSKLLDEIKIRKEAEEKLTESERLYRLLTVNAKDMVALLNNNETSEFIYVSPSAKEVLGYEPHELIGRSAFFNMHEDDLKKMQESAHPQTMEMKSLTTEFRVRKKDGSVIWLEVVSSPFVDSHTGRNVFHGIARDITQWKAAQEEIRLAKERTEKDSARLRELMDEKNDLIDLLSHDLRSPVNRVYGLAQLMSFSLDDKVKLKGLIAMVEQTANDQLALLKNLLSMLRLDQFVSETEPFAPTSLLSLVKNVQKKIDLELKNKNISLSISIPEDLEIRVQATYFIEAIQNLLTNAIKFSPPGETVTMQAEIGPSQIDIIIRDNGMGFDPEKADALFDRFTKEGRKGTNNEASTGLGLFLVKKIVKNHNGKISAYSAGDGKGSTFTIQLPIDLS